MKNYKMKFILNNDPRTASFTAKQFFAMLIKDRVWKNEMIGFELFSANINHNVKFSIITNHNILPIIIKNSFTNGASKCIF